MQQAGNQPIVPLALVLAGTQWQCPGCGGTEFRQMVVAENMVTFRSTDDGYVLESDDFRLSWEVTERKQAECAGCNQPVSLAPVPPDSIMEESEYQD